MKICSKCKNEKSDGDFEFRNKTKGIRKGICKVCCRIYSKHYYKLNKKDCNRRKTIGAKRRQAPIKDVINKLKSKPCLDCKQEYHFVCMDFDHLDSDEKEYDISAMINLGYKLDKILKEINKCELVCSNCHRLRTYNRRRDVAQPG